MMKMRTHAFAIDTFFHDQVESLMLETLSEDSQTRHYAILTAHTWMV